MQEDSALISARSYKRCSHGNAVPPRRRV
jgi:hypothetical protein